LDLSHNISTTHVEIISILQLIGVGKGLVCRASIGDIVGTSDCVGQLVEGSTTTDVAGSHCDTRAEVGGGDLIEKDTAEVDLYFI